MTKSLPPVTADHWPLTAQATQFGLFLGGLLSTVGGLVAKRRLRWLILGQIQRVSVSKIDLYN